MGVRVGQELSGSGPFMKVDNLIPALAGMTEVGRKCEYRLLGVNVRSCCIAVLHRGLGNGELWGAFLPSNEKYLSDLLG